MISLVLEQFFEYEKRLTYIEGFPITAVKTAGEINAIY